jgi:uncharacterized alkaline shock family protein YloU
MVQQAHSALDATLVPDPVVASLHSGHGPVLHRGCNTGGWSRRFAVNLRVPQPLPTAARLTIGMGHAAHARAEPSVGGTVAVTNEAVAHVVGLTVLECYGVVGMAATSLTQGVARLLTRDRLTQGVSVRRSGDGLSIDLYIVVEFGLNLADIAANVRSRVQYQVQKLTQMPVHSLQIHIQGVKRTP